MNRTFAVLVLERAGFDVYFAENGAQAVELLSKTDYALVLMDYRMPVLDGVETTKRIRAGGALARNQGVPIIALTANAFQSSRDKCIAAGMNDWISKPASGVALLQIVRKWLPSLNPDQTDGDLTGQSEKLKASEVQPTQRSVEL